MTNPHLLTPTVTWGADPSGARLGLLAVHGRGQTPAYMRGITDRIGGGLQPDGATKASSATGAPGATRATSAAVPLDGVAVFAPHAANDSWYPNPFMQPLASNQPQLDEAVQAIDAAVAGIVATGIPIDRIVLLGFSQGACLLSHYALLNPRRYAALVLLTGGFIGPDGTDTAFTGDFDGTPALVRCASDDGWVPAERARETAAELARLGAVVDLHIEDGSEHIVTDDSIAAARALLARL